MNVNASLDIDNNRKTIQGNGAFRVSSAWTFAAATTGAIAQHVAFTVTGDVLLSIFGVVQTTLTSGGAATISAGTAGNVAALIGATTAANLAANDVWVDTTDTRVDVGPVPAAGTFVIANGADIILNIAAATLTGGVLNMYVTWRPLNSTGLVVATTPA